jgi:hypothetical protein
MCLFAEVYEEVPACWAVHSPVGYGVTPRIRTRRVACYDGQDVGPGAVEQVDREEVARQDRVGLGAQEL